MSFLLKSLNVGKAQMQRSLQVVEGEFAHAEELLADGRQFLAGDRLSAADLSFATMAVPALLLRVEEGMGARIPYKEEVSDEYGAIADRLRQTNAGRHALKVFAEYRRPSVIPTLPDVRQAPPPQAKKSKL